MRYVSKIDCNYSIYHSFKRASLNYLRKRPHILKEFRIISGAAQDVPLNMQPSKADEHKLPNTKLSR